MNPRGIHEIRQKYPWLGEILDTQREEMARLKALNTTLINSLREAGAHLTHLAEIHGSDSKTPRDRP